MQKIKKKVKAEHLRQKLAKTYNEVEGLMGPIFDKTRSEAAAEVVQKLSKKHLKRIEANPERFKQLSPDGDLARLAKDELALRASAIYDK